MATTNLSLAKGRSKSKLGVDFDANMDALDSFLGHALGFNPTANGAKFEIKSASELMTVAAAATSTSVADLLPANALILGVVGRVTTNIPTAANFTIGDGTTAARFGSCSDVVVNTTFNSGFTAFNPGNTNAAGPVQGAAAKIVLTPNAQPATNAGRVRVTVYYAQMSEPTS